MLLFDAQKNAFMSNSGTLTSCFADFIKFPKPAFRAKRSLSSRIVSIECWFSSMSLLGEPLRVGGRDKMSISIMIEDLRRKAGSRGNSGLEGDVDRFSIIGECLGLWTAVDGRANDHERTRSNANTWQPMENQLHLYFEPAGQSLPILQNTRDICNTKLNSALPEISLVPFAACSVFDRNCENSSAKLGSS